MEDVCRLCSRDSEWLNWEGYCWYCLKEDQLDRARYRDQKEEYDGE